MSTPLPERQRLHQRIGALALIAVGILFIWRSLADLPLGTIDNPGPGITPLVLAGLLVVCALWSLTGGGRDMVARADTGEPDDAGEPGALRHALIVIAGVAAAALLLGVLGYRLTVLLLLVFFLGLVERKPIIAVLLIGFGLSFGSHALFVHVLKVSLPSGPWGL
jgi:hypothetical protein